MATMFLRRPQLLVAEADRSYSARKQPLSITIDDDEGQEQFKSCARPTRAQARSSMESPRTRTRTTQNLPDGVVVHALSFLNHVDLCAAATTARRWRQAVDTRALWTALLEKRCPALLRTLGTCGEPRQLFTRMARKVEPSLPERPLADVVLYLETRYHGETTLSMACPLDELVPVPPQDGWVLSSAEYLLRPSPADQTGPLDVVGERRHTDFKFMNITLIRKSDGAMIRSGERYAVEDSWSVRLSPRRPGHSFVRQYLADYGEMENETPELVMDVQAMNLTANPDSWDEYDPYDDRFERGDFKIEFGVTVCSRFSRTPEDAAFGISGYVANRMSEGRGGIPITPRLLASLDWET